MKLHRNLARIVTIGLVAFALAGCASYHDRRAGNTLLGAGLGAGVGAIFSGGDPLYTLGGAAAGGVLGNVLTENRHYSRPAIRERGRSYRPARGHYRSYSRDRRGWHGR